MKNVPASRTRKPATSRLLQLTTPPCAVTLPFVFHTRRTGLKQVAALLTAIKTRIQLFEPASKRKKSAWFVVSSVPESVSPGAMLLVAANPDESVPINKNRISATYLLIASPGL